MPSNSDMIKWAEQGRLHVSSTLHCTSGSDGTGVGTTSATWTVGDNLMILAYSQAGTTTTGGNGAAIAIEKRSDYYDL